VVFDTGAGDSFTDIYGLKRLLTMVYSQRLIQRLGIPIVMVPQTIGPFKSTVGRFAGRRAIKRMTCVLARDKVSADCSADLRRPVDLVSTDLVFMLPKPNDPISIDVLFNVSGLLWDQNPHVDFVAYRRWVRDTIDGLVELGRNVTLFAHVLDSPRLDNDVPVVESLKLEYGPARVASLVPDSLLSARNAISGANILIGTRMHACLNALSLGTPAIAWAYSRKFEPLMSSLDWELVLDLKSQTDVAAETLNYVAELERGKYSALSTEKMGREKSEMAARAIKSRWDYL
jgi:polysaccharide pyruvyl transferase WcaK-like protein